jgi:hypothetical protein
MHVAWGMARVALVLVNDCSGSLMTRPEPGNILDAIFKIPYFMNYGKRIRQSTRHPQSPAALGGVQVADAALSR